MEPFFRGEKSASGLSINYVMFVCVQWFADSRLDHWLFEQFRWILSDGHKSVEEGVLKNSE